MQIGGGLPQISFYNINCVLFLNPQLNFQCLQSDSTNCVAKITRRDFVKGYSYNYTLCREIKHPNAAVHCLQQTYKQTQTTLDSSAVICRWFDSFEKLAKPNLVLQMDYKT